MAAPTGIVVPERDKEDMDALNTQAHGRMVDAINEVLADEQALAAAAVQMVVATINHTTQTAAIPALPAGSIIVGADAIIPTAFSAGAAIEIGDHSGGSGALVAAALTAALGTATTIGNYGSPFYYTPVGALQVAVTDAPTVGAATVLIRYITPNA